MGTQKSGRNLRIGLVVIVAIIIWSGSFAINFQPNTLSVEVVAPAQRNILELYYDISQGFNENDVLRVEIPPSAKPVQVYWQLLPEAPLRAFRIDPGVQPGTMQLQRLQIQHVFVKLNRVVSLYEWTPGQWLKDFRPQQDVGEMILNQEAQLRITTTGADPQIEYVGDMAAVYASIKSTVWRFRLGAAIGGTLVCGGLLWLISGLLLRQRSEPARA